MRTHAQELTLWSPSGRKTSRDSLKLAALVRELGAHDAAARWRESTPHLDLAHVHGERHDLWWEFALSASFRWQSHLSRLTPEFCQGRIRKLTWGLGLERLLEQPVQVLTPAERVRANLAVALLPQPDLLLWEEPFCQVAQQDAAWLSDFVRSLVRTEGLSVVAVATREPGLAWLDAPQPPLLRAVR